MATTLAQLAELVGGLLVGDGSIELHGAAVLDSAAAGEITLIDNADKLRRLGLTQATAVVVPASVTAVVNLPGIIVDDVHHAFALIVCHFRPRRSAGRREISPAAHIAASARLGDNVAIQPGAIIGEDVTIGAGATIHGGVHIMAGCQIGPDVTLMPGVVLYEDTIVGARTVIHAGAALGTHGFGYETVNGRHVPSPQLGYVEVESDVEIGANTTIDRGTYGRTLIGAGTKIDNLVQIAHNCRIGRHNLICAQVGIAGSTTTGDYVVMAGQVGICDHVNIGTGTIVGAQAGVTNDLAPGLFVLGSPAIPLRDQKVKLAAESKLPEMRKEFRALKRSVEQLLGQVEQVLGPQGTEPSRKTDSSAAA